MQNIKFVPPYALQSVNFDINNASDVERAVELIENGESYLANGADALANNAKASIAICKCPDCNKTLAQVLDADEEANYQEFFKTFKKDEGNITLPNDNQRIIEGVLTEKYQQRKYLANISMRHF